jgi:hypothetical protein
VVSSCEFVSESTIRRKSTRRREEEDAEAEARGATQRDMTFAFADEGEEKYERGGEPRGGRRWGKDRRTSFGWEKG